MTDNLATWGGWEPEIRDDPFGHFADARARCPVQKARLADGGLEEFEVLGIAEPCRERGGGRLGPGPLAEAAGQ